MLRKILQMKRSTYPVVTGLVLLGHGFVLGLDLRVGVGPPLAQLLGDIANAILRVDGLHLGPLIVAEPEEGRPEQKIHPFK